MFPSLDRVYDNALARGISVGGEVGLRSDCRAPARVGDMPGPLAKQVGVKATTPSGSRARLSGEGDRLSANSPRGDGSTDPAATPPCSAERWRLVASRRGGVRRRCGSAVVASRLRPTPARRPSGAHKRLPRRRNDPTRDPTHGDGWRLMRHRSKASTACVDLDFGFTPATNVLQLSRIALRPQ